MENDRVPQGMIYRINPADFLPPAPVILRDYQETGLQGMREALRSFRSVLYVLPCGGGKGAVTTFIVREAVARGLRVTFVVRGLALVNDMVRRLRKLGLSCGVLRGGKKRDLDNPVQVASADTLFRMPEPPHSDIIILDEARTFSNETGARIVGLYPGAKIIGLDATPVLINGKGLGAEVGGHFENIVVGPDEQELIDRGFLCPSLPLGTGDPPDVSKVSKVGGEFDTAELAEVCNKPKLVGDIVEHWLREATGLKTIAFCVNRAHAIAVQAAFLSAEIEWEFVHGEMPDDEREAIYERLDHGTLMGISNVWIAGVGWDHPVIQCVIAGAPTWSLSRWRQEMGRGSRLYAGKRRFIVIDHAGNTVRHWPFGFFETPPLWTLAGFPKSRKAKDATAAADPISMCKRPVPVPPGGVPSTFTGPLSKDGRTMLPCFCYFKSGPPECPRCGLPLLKVGRKIETEAGQLKDLSVLRDAARSARTVQLSAHDQKMRQQYLELVERGMKSRTRDGQPYSKKWATMQFRMEFGRFPSKALIEEGRRLQATQGEIVCT